MTQVFDLNGGADGIRTGSTVSDRAHKCANALDIKDLTQHPTHRTPRKSNITHIGTVPVLHGNRVFDRALHGYRQTDPVRAHMRRLEALADGDIPFIYEWSDPAIERAYNCALKHLYLLQGEYIDSLYDRYADEL